MTASAIEVPVSIMAGLQEARVRDDDWTGKTDPAERRKRQNRLHQRAWRRRKQHQQQRGSATHFWSDHSCHRDADNTTVRPAIDGGVSIRQLVQDHVSGRNRMQIAFESPQSRFEFWEALETMGEPQSIFAYWAELRAQRKREITSALLVQDPSLVVYPRAPRNRASGNKQVNSVRPVNDINPNLKNPHDQMTSAFELPLSVDHRLFVLIQYNALRGVMTNMSILLHRNGRPLEGWADFYTEDLSTPPDNAPSSLQPTYLQKTVTHESWIDVIPYANMRDNIIRKQDSLDVDALCDDFLGEAHEGLSEEESRGLVLWGEPWSENGWEISEGFAKKWSFLLKGCSDLIESTNRWRGARGEERLIVEL